MGILLMFLALAGNAQNTSFEVKTYYGVYNMADMQDMQQQARTNTDVPFRVIDEVTGYWGYEIALGVTLPNTDQLNLFAGLNSTGGRLHYSDFSGSASFDQVLRGTHLGAEFLKRLSNNNGFTVEAGLRAGVSFTRLDLRSSLQLNTTGSSSEEQQFNSFAPHLGPRFAVRKLLSNFYIGAFAGYDYNFAGKLKLSTNKEAFLIDRNNDQIKADWGGFRIGLSLGIQL